MLSEFELIDRFFATTPRADIKVGMGDDACLLQAPAGQTVVSTVSSLTHDSPGSNTDNPQSFGYRAVSLALNRLAAKGTRGRWLTLSLTLPEVDEHWLAPFALGIQACAKDHQVSLVGGDTTRGPLNIIITALGCCEPCKIVHEYGTQATDGLFVTGSLGTQGAMALLGINAATLDDKNRRDLLRRADNPSARSDLSHWLRNTAHACVSLDHGLHSALNRLLTNTDIGARVQIAAVPVEAILLTQLQMTGNWRPLLSLAGDHELLFSAPANLQASPSWPIGIHRIGQCRAMTGIDYEWPA